MTNKKRTALVTGAGGFIGHHLVNRLVKDGFFVRGVDLKYPLYEKSQAHEFFVFDLRNRDSCADAVEGMEDVYHLAADMGGIGYIGTQKSQIAENNALIDTHMLRAAKMEACTERFFFSSSACAYPMWLQDGSKEVNLKEEMAWPAAPEPGYGMEKLFMEEMCRYANEEHKLKTFVARFHNVFGPLGTYEGGKEKAPAAICRKVALAKHNDTIEVWGDGKQRRSYTYIDDCIEGVRRLVESVYHCPLNIGSDVAITTDELVELVADIAGKNVQVSHNITAPTGVLSRNSDNEKIKSLLGWEPAYGPGAGLIPTYDWINKQVTLPRNTKVRVAG